MGWGAGRVVWGGGVLPIFEFPQQFLTSPCEAGAVLPPRPSARPTQLPRKAGEAGLHLAAGVQGFGQSQGKV